MTDISLLRIWHTISLLGEIKEEVRDHKRILSLATDAETTLLLTLQTEASAGASSETIPS